MDADHYVIEFWGGPRDGQRTEVGDLYDHYVLAYAPPLANDLAPALDNLPVKTFRWTYNRTEQTTGDGATIYKLGRENASY